MSLDSKFNQADIILSRMTTAAEKEIVRAYAASLKKIRAQLAEIYAKYEREGALTYAEMAKYNRLNNLFSDVSGELKNMTGANARLTKKLASDVYQESYYRAAWAIEGEVQAALRYGLLNPKTIEASVQNPLSGLTLNERLQKNRADVIVRLREQITQGLVQGESYAKMAARIKGVLEGDAAKAVKVAQTEAHRNQMAGRLASSQHASEAGVKFKKVWIATLDTKTRDTHQAMDGQAVDPDEDFKSPSGASGPAPGMLGAASEDINCRCSFRLEIEGYGPEVRRARGEDGQSELVRQQSYKEWAEAKGVGLKYKGPEPSLSKTAATKPFTTNETQARIEKARELLTEQKRLQAELRKVNAALKKFD